MKPISEIKDEKILIDTNILTNCGREEFGQEFKKILRILSDNGNNLAISVISGFEIIKKYSNEKKVVDYYIALLNYIQNILINLETLNIAGIIANRLYSKKDEYRKDNDFIIGATVIMNKSFLLTCNIRDFKKPLWEIVARDCVYYEDEKGCRKVENIFLLKPSNDKWKELHKLDFYALLNKI